MKPLKVLAILMFLTAGLSISSLWLLHGYPMYQIRKVKMSEIEFYGRIVAQDGSPIEGVSLNAEWGSYPENLFAYFLSGDSNTNHKALISDWRGNFSITGIRGVDLILKEFSHPSYELAGSKKGWGFSFISDSSERHEADSRNPFTITMRDANPNSGPNTAAQKTASPSSGL